MTRTTRRDRQMVPIGEAQQRRYGFRAPWQHDDVRLVRGEPFVASVFGQHGGCEADLARRQNALQLRKQPALLWVHRKAHLRW
jgi:hypothetical protein